MRCTQATLTALGIPNVCPKTGGGVLEALAKFGKSYNVVDYQGTVQKFIKSHSKGQFYISTNRHAMALVDGILTDTSERGPDRRQVWLVVEVK